MAGVVALQGRWGGQEVGKRWWAKTPACNQGAQHRQHRRQCKTLLLSSSATTKPCHAPCLFFSPPAALGVLAAQAVKRGRVDAKLVPPVLPRSWQYKSVPLLLAPRRPLLLLPAAAAAARRVKPPCCYCCCPATASLLCSFTLALRSSSCPWLLLCLGWA